MELIFEWHARSDSPMGVQLGYNVYFAGIEHLLSNLQQSSTFSFLPKKLRSSAVILHDHAGDSYFIDLTEDPPRVFYNMLEDPNENENGWPIVEFFRFILEVWETVEIQVDPEFEEEIEMNVDAYFEIEQKFQEQIQNPKI